MFFGAASFTLPALAERPTAPRLLPKDTLLMIRIGDSRELSDQFKQTAMGKIVSDEQVQPFLSHLYGSATDAFGEVEEQVGASLTDILSLPQGEVCIALVAPEEGEPAIVALIEVGNQLGTAEKLLARGQEAAVNGGADRSTETYRETKLNIYENTGPRNRTVVQFVKDGVVGIVGNLTVAKELLDRWEGEEGETLVDEDRYAAIMSRCQGSKEERPQLTFYVDPISIAAIAASRNAAAGPGAALIPVLGLDGLQGIGGSVIMPKEDFDMVIHLHVLLDNPRAGVVEMLALGTGDVEPEPWTPADARSYATLHWKVDETYSALKRLYDSFFGDGELDGLVDERLSQPLDVDVKKEVIDALEGRLVHVGWIEKPYRFNSQSNLLAAKLNDADSFRKTLEKLLSNVPSGRIENRVFAGVEYYHIDLPQPGQRRRQQAENNENRDNDQPERVRFDRRHPEGCVCILGDYVLWCDSEKLLKEAITSKSNPDRSLAQELDFKLIHSKIKRQIGGGTPAWISFDRPEQGMRLWYEMAQAANTREVLAQRSENNRGLDALKRALDENPLPPFAVIEKYLAPGGSVLINDESGVHWTAFSLKRD